MGEWNSQSPIYYAAGQGFDTWQRSFASHLALAEDFERLVWNPKYTSSGSMALIAHPVFSQGLSCSISSRPMGLKA